MQLVQNFRRVIYDKYLLLLVAIASVLRFVNLGYSDFQGDEIKALFLPESGQGISEFLLTQRKGPIQFVITYLLKFANPEYDNQLLMRLPFAVAGILAVVFFYKFLKWHFNEKVAFYASFFVATNGFFIAFSRIVQYQSFVILFSVLALYCFTLAIYKANWQVKGIYLGFIFWALSVLSHYDGVFIFPFVGYLLFAWARQQALTLSLKNLKHPIYAGLIFTGLLLVFYIPFILSIDEATRGYWQGRIVGTGGKVSSSSYLFRVYQPIYVIHIYTILFALGIVKIFLDNVGQILFSGLVSTRMLFQFAKTRFLGIGALLLLLFKDSFQKSVALMFWFMLAFIFFEGFVDIAGTHIYTYLLPLTVFLGFGVLLIEELIHRIFSLVNLGKFAKHVSFIGVFVIFSFIFAQSYAIFVDHAREYPWESEKFLIWEFHKPSPVFHLSMFGFPYYRQWEDISTFIINDRPTLPCPILVGLPDLLTEQAADCKIEVDKIPYYSTNERDSIARHHIPFAKSTADAGYYVHIRYPQSFTDEILNSKAAYWAQNYEPVKTFYKDSCGRPNLSNYCTMGMRSVVDVYYMPQGSLDEIIEMGY
jgi:hypothetical protein